MATRTMIFCFIHGKTMANLRKGTWKIYMSKISLKYISLHIYNSDPSRVIMNIKLSSHGFLFHRNMNKRAGMLPMTPKNTIPTIKHGGGNNVVTTLIDTRRRRREQANI